MHVVVSVSTIAGEWQVALDLDTGTADVWHGKTRAGGACYAPGGRWSRVEPESLREILDQAAAELAPYDSVLAARRRLLTGEGAPRS